MRKKTLLIFITATLLVGGVADYAAGRVFSTREEALQQAFPGADSIDMVNLYLTEQELEQVYRASGVKPDSSLYTFYAGRSNGRVTGYAAIEAAIVRTLQETVIVVLEPDGSVRYTEILAFFEPDEYRPPKRWLDQFIGKVLSTQLRIGGDIQGITGATLSAQAITRQVRKSAAMLKVHLAKGKP